MHLQNVASREVKLFFCEKRFLALLTVENGDKYVKAPHESAVLSVLHLSSTHSGTPDAIRTHGLQSRSFQAVTDKMLYFQRLYGFRRKHPIPLNFPETIENTRRTGFSCFAEDSSQTVVTPRR